MSRMNTPRADKPRLNPTEKSARGTRNKGRKIKVHGIVPWNNINPTSKGTNAMAQWKRESSVWTTGKVSSGNTIFLTKFGWPSISFGELVMTSEHKLKRLSPQNSVNPKSVADSFLVRLKRDLKMNPKTKR